MSIYVAPKASLPAKAGPQGPGAGVLQTEFPLSYGIGLGKQSPQKKMQRAWQLGTSVPWIRAAELTIGGWFTTVPWHLEDENEDTIEKGDALDIIAHPQANLRNGDPDWKRLSRADLWRLTCRHVGLCGNAFWFLDSLNTFRQPASILYIRPDRMFPEEDRAGNLIGWSIDKTASDPGIPVTLSEVIQFMFEPPDIGHFGIGLVESALMKAQLSTALDEHLGSVLDAGGRLSGFLAPKTGTLGSDQMVSLERDWRSIVEQSDPAKRLQLVAAPVDFTSTVMSPQDMQIRDLMTGARDDLLGMWGVPVSKLGIHDRGRGLNGGTVVEHDDATLWQQAVKPRLGGHDQGGFVELVQSMLLDRYAQTDGVCELIIEEPTFDDDAPKYIEAQQALSVPLRNRERRDILGYDPLGDDVLNPVTGARIDDEVWLPMTQVLAYVAPSEDAPQPNPEPAPVPLPDQTPAAANAAGETTQSPLPPGQVKAVVSPRVKPLHDSLVKLRANLDARMTPKVRASVAAFLDDQRRDIAARLRKHAAHLTSDPGDTSVWFPARVYDQKLAAALAPTLSVVAGQVSEHIGTVLGPGKADPVGGPVEKVLLRGAARVTRINQTTRDKVQSIITTGIANGLTILDVADALDAQDFESIDGTAFDAYRSEMIARTEMMDAYNAAALGSYQEAGIEMVEAIDGDQDEECIARLARNPYTIDEADAEEDHPNGTLDWVPVLPGMATLPKRDETPLWVPALIAAMTQQKADPVQVVMPDTGSSRLVFDRDEDGRITAVRSGEEDQRDRFMEAMANQPAPHIEVHSPVTIAEGAVQVTMPKTGSKRLERDDRGNIVRMVDE